MTIHLYKGDLPAGLDLGRLVAMDTETLGLTLGRDRLCVVQLSSGDGHSHLVQIPKPGPDGAPPVGDGPDNVCWTCRLRDPWWGRAKGQALWERPPP